MNTRITTVLAGAAALAALAGCGSDDKGGATAKTPAATTQSATSTLAGNYTRTVTSSDLNRTDSKRQEGPGQERPKPGPVALTLTQDTLKLTDIGPKFTVLQDYSATTDGSFRIGAYQHPERASFCGPDVSQSATYTWKLSGNVLTLKAVQDPCADRDSDLSGDWKRR